jgi:cysteine synthase A
MYNLFKTGKAEASHGGSDHGRHRLGRVTPIIQDIKVDKPISFPTKRAVPVIFDLLSTKGCASAARPGINVAGAIRLAKELGKGKTIVTVLADYGNRLQSKLFIRTSCARKKLPVPVWLEKQVRHRRPFVKSETKA